jgi:hypothetical protein
MAVHLSRSTVYQMQWMGLMVCCGMAVRRMGLFGVSVRNMKVMNMKMETVTVIGN